MPRRRVRRIDLFTRRVWLLRCVGDTFTTMLRYAATIFLSAFLLFLVQPLIGKFILPWFGGTPGVWTTCMLFFQIVLLAGYAYAHLIASHLSLKKQAIVHIILLLLSLAVLPIVPNGDIWKPTGGEAPTGRILLLLLVTLGPPYLMLSATGPLLQAWFSRTNPGQSPWRLYALSNAGSLLALLAYPFALEPTIGRWSQAIFWSAGYAAFVTLCGVVAVVTMRAKPGTAVAASGAASAAGKDYNRRVPGAVEKLLWLLLPMVASVMLLATTSHLCQDIAVIPFLWVLPLALYLLTFIIAFDADRWYNRGVVLPVLLVCIGLLAVTMNEYEFDASIRPLFQSTIWQIGLYSVLLFAACLVCHGELFRLRPTAAGLTGYYLTISAGGALGGIFVALIAPLIFDTYAEFWLGLGAVVGAAGLCLWRDPESPLAHGRKFGAWGLALLAIGVSGWFIQKSLVASSRDVVDRSRNFYGTLSIRETYNDQNVPVIRKLRHGRIEHGSQMLIERFRDKPTTYYGALTAMNMTDVAMRDLRHRQPMNVGLVGLGVGTMAAYGKPGDRFTMYEINPDVVELAESQFTYIADARARGAEVEIVLGDARLSLERELKSGSPRNFDLLVLDAFSGDAIPLHLLTLEAFETYTRHLKPDGMIVAHITNNHVDLRGPLWKLGEACGFSVALFATERYNASLVANDRTGLPADWIIMSRDASFFEHRSFFATIPGADGQPQLVAQRIENDNRRPASEVELWTDDHADLLRWLKKSQPASP